jgi:DNA-binding response OmpR family regulator
MSAPASTILVVDDTPQNIRLLEAVLTPRGYRVVAAGSGAEALAAIAAAPPDLVLLDVVMPGMDGYEVCRRLREDPATRLLPVVMITASGDQEKVDAIEAGADDFVAKPFNPAELLARIETALRRAAPTPRTEPAGPTARQQLDGLVIDHERCRATVDGAPLALTPTEYRLLRALASRPGTVIPREELAESVWGYHDYGVGRSLDVHMRRLRGKLNAGGATAPSLLTARGFGYRLVGAGGEAGPG